MTRPEINFHSELESFSLSDEKRLIQWLEKVIHSEGKEVALLNYIFCSDDYLLEINRQYLDHDYYTDILSFPLKSDPIEGDIFISVDRVKENAQEFNTDFADELHRVMVHGLLHFIGYDDHTEDAIQRMRNKENEYLVLVKRDEIP